MSNTDTLDQTTLGENFKTKIDQIDADYRGKLPNSTSVKNCHREDILSNFAGYFMRHFQAARDVIHSEGASNEDLMQVGSMLDELAGADNYFLETYNDSERRKLQIFVSKQLNNPESVETNMLEAMVIMLDAQIGAEKIKISSAQSMMDTSVIVNNTLDGE